MTPEQETQGYLGELRALARGIALGSIIGLVGIILGFAIMGALDLVN